MPSRPLLFLYCLARVHQEDHSYLFLLEVACPVGRCCSRTTLLVSTKRTTALPWQDPDHCSRTCSLTHCQCRRNILIAIIIYLAAFWLPKSLDYSGRAIQVHTQERAIQVHTQERAIQCTLRTCDPSAHPRTCYPSARYTRAPLCTLVHRSYSGTTRALLRNLVHYSCTATYFHAPISCTTHTHAPLLLVHHSFSCTTPHSCTAS